MINRKIAPPIKDAIEYSLNLKPYDRFDLDNGVPVYTINTGSQDVMQVEWVYYAGNYFESKQGVASATNFMLKNGTSKQTAFQLNESFDYYGAYCNRSCFNETAVLSLHGLSKHMVKLLPVVHEMLTDAQFPEEELETYKQNAKQRLLVSMKKCEFVAGRLIDSYVYGDKHPYGCYTLPSDIDALDVSALREFYKNHYLSGHCAIFVSGKVPDQFSKELNRIFGKIQVTAPGRALPVKPVTPAVEKKQHIINDAASVQGAIRLAMPFPNRHHPDFKKAVVLNNVFGGFFGSRLMSNIREDKGYTYGIYSYLQNHIQQSAWVISTEAGKDVCEATIREVYKEMELLRNEPVDEDELLLVRNYMIGSILGDLDGPFHIMAKWKNIILNNLDESYFYDSVEAIKTVSSADLRELANKYLVPEQYYELVVY